MEKKQLNYKLLLLLFHTKLDAGKLYIRKQNTKKKKEKQKHTTHSKYLYRNFNVLKTKL